MKKRLLLLLYIIMMSLPTMADSWYLNQGEVEIGGIIYYINLTDSTAEVRRPRPYYKNYLHIYGDSIIILPRVSYKGNTYDVISINTAFEWQEWLTYVKIPNSIKTIRHNAFYGCGNLRVVHFPNTDVLIDDMAFDQCGFKSLIIPSNVHIDGDGVFAYCPKLQDVTIDTNRLNSNTFCGCGNLTTVTMNNVTEIGDFCFWRCSALNSITFSDSLTSIGERAFEECIALSSISFPNSLVKIGYAAFCNCIGLCDSIIFPNSLVSIGDFAFGGCDVLTSVSFTNSHTRIGALAFEACHNLTAIDLPQDLDSIMRRTFFNCSRLTSINIPRSVTYIGNEAFRNCYELNRMSLLCTTPPDIEDNTFENQQYNNIELNVPVGCKDLYQSHLYWGKFKNINEVEMSVIKSPQNDIQQDKVDCIYNIRGELLPAKDYNQLSKGLYIVNGKKIVK